ncbi:Xaa-Pro peptidase family protein [Oscillatoria amoena NRMC-F 0135]|nr:Xaa-Pro peptidase family protein [Oscillatoria amoena NRMC-F 0135]
MADVIAAVLRERKLREVEVPPDFPLRLAEELNERGIWLETADRIFPEREFKKPAEVKAIVAALRMTEAGLRAGINLLRAARIEGRHLVAEGRVLTSERVRAEIDAAIVRLGGLPAHTIVAGGKQACDPHERGSGPLRPHQTIILDVFPRDQKSGYYGDMTRTVVRGRANETVKAMYAAVLEGQKYALRKLRPGADGNTIHEHVKNLFAERGFPTKIKKGRQSGFFHGTGHGIGLEIHETPRFSQTTFKSGQVITVEPGLYDRDIGGVRIEDVALVTRTGHRVLSDFPKQLEI